MVNQSVTHSESAASRRVSVIMPVRNEADHIEACLRGVLDQDYDPSAMEVLVADGMSNDGTREKIEALAKRDSRVRLVDNPGRIVSTGLNAALREAGGELVIRMDAHTEYAPDYIRQCVRVQQATGAENVGGAWKAVGRTYLQQAIAIAFQSRFSSGGAASHAVNYEGEVDSVYLGCWPRDILDKIGGFDEELVRNQDDELNLRLKRAGGKIYQSPAIKSQYYPRSSLVALFRQYSQYGYWKVRVIQKHKIPASVRHLVPGLFVLVVTSLFVLEFPFPALRIAFAAVLAAYLLANAMASLVTCARPARFKFLPILPVVFAVYHFSYGYGFLRGFLDFVVRRKSPSTAFTQLTRSSRAPS